MTTATAKKRQTKTIIERGKSYSLSELPVSTWALRSARANGLKVRYVCGRAFVLGDDWIDWLATQPTTPPVGSGRKVEAQAR